MRTAGSTSPAKTCYITNLLCLVVVHTKFTSSNPLLIITNKDIFLWHSGYEVACMIRLTLWFKIIVIWTSKSHNSKLVAINGHLTVKMVKMFGNKKTMRALYFNKICWFSPQVSPHIIHTLAETIKFPHGNYTPPLFKIKQSTLYDTWRPGQKACKLLNKGQTTTAEFIFTSRYLDIANNHTSPRLRNIHLNVMLIVEQCHLTIIQQSYILLQPSGLKVSYTQVFSLLPDMF